MAQPRTKPSTPRLSDAARKVVLPSGITSTGWPAVEDKAADFGVRFRWWQAALGRVILAKREDGKYASTIGGTGISIPRQSGKTFLVGAIVFALCLLHPKLTVIWTAHRLRTSEETFEKMKAFAQRKRIAPFVTKVVLGSGEEAIWFTNGSRILFGARAEGFGRGFDEVDVLVFDEAQILKDSALDDMIPAMNQSRQAAGGLLLFMGTPPKPTDAGEAFIRMRDEALSGEDEDTGWVEFGADPGFLPTPTPAKLKDTDWAQVEKANPSFPDDTPREAILRMRKKLGPESFIREGLGIWDEVRTTAAFGPGVWDACAADPVAGLPLAALAVAADNDLTRFSIVGAALDGDVVQVRAIHFGDNGAAAATRAAELSKEHRVAVAVDGRGPASVLILPMQQAGADVVPMKGPEVMDACADVSTAVRDRLLRHSNFKELDDAVEGAGKKRIGDRWAWDRRSDVVVAPLEAMTLAHWLLTRPQEPPARSAYADHDLIII